MDCSLPGFSVHGISQARILVKVKVKVKSLSRVRLFVTPWTVAYQASTRLLRPWDFPGKNTGVGRHFLLQESESESEVTQSCPTLCDPVDCSLPSSSVHVFSRQEYWSGLLLRSEERNWCKRKGYNFSVRKVKEIYEKSSGLIAMFPKDGNTMIGRYFPLRPISCFPYGS